LLLLSIATLGLAGTATAQLQTESIRVTLPDRGQLQQIDNLVSSKSVRVEADGFSGVTGCGSFANNALAPVKSVQLVS
jgi:hypothetical protein